jgi:hypothetical protein
MIQFCLDDKSSAGHVFFIHSFFSTLHITSDELLFLFLKGSMRFCFLDLSRRAVLCRPPCRPPLRHPGCPLRFVSPRSVCPHDPHVVPPCTHIEICWDVLKLEVIHVNWLADLCCASSFQYNNGSDYLLCYQTWLCDKLSVSSIWLLKQSCKNGRGSLFVMF